VKLIAALIVGVLAIATLGLGSVSAGVAAVKLDTGALTEEVLAHPSIHLSTSARSDVERGLIDARVLATMLVLAQRHELTRVGPLVTGHSFYVKGTTRPSNHSFGRAMDITAIDRARVSGSNLGAFDAVRILADQKPPLRPDEIGSPWPLRFDGMSTIVRDHADHLHIGFSG
jgi:hypothetical protein